MSNLMEEAMEKLINEAMEKAAQKIASGGGDFYNAEQGIKELIKNRAIELFKTDPEILTAFKAKILGCINKIDVESFNKRPTY